MLRNYKSVMILGLVFLIVANVLLLTLRHSQLLSADVADGVIGFAYGLAIAMLVFAVRLKTRASRCA